MPFFGQVWVWSLAGFLVGALLCWILIANPARRRVADLQKRLAASRRREIQTPVPDYETAYADPLPRSTDFGDDYESHEFRSAPALVPGFDDARDNDYRAELGRREAEHDDRHERRGDGTEFDQALFAAEHARLDTEDDYDDAGRDDQDRVEHQDERDEYDRADHETEDDADERGALRLGEPEETRHAGSLLGEAVETTQYIPAGRAAELSDASAEKTTWFAGRQGTADEHLVDDLAEAEAEIAQGRDEDDPSATGGGTIFTQHTTPIPAELIRRIDAEGEQENTDDALIDDLDEDQEEQAAPDRTEVVPAPAASIDAATQFVRPVPPTPVVEPEPLPAPPIAQPVVATDPAEEPNLAYGEVRTTSAVGALPKRIPAKPQGRIPFGVQPAPPAPATPATATAPASEAERSLFEPIRHADETVAATSVLPESRPRRSRTALKQAPTGGVDSFVPPGPFGPGSAMPLPGGESPSSDYTIKASVTALRYCSPESPKFDRTIAEVWFRSVADAERVGFRPLA